MQEVVRVQTFWICQSHRHEDLVELRADRGCDVIRVDCPPEVPACLGEHPDSRGIRSAGVLAR